SAHRWGESRCMAWPAARVLAVARPRRPAASGAPDLQWADAPGSLPGRSGEGGPAERARKAAAEAPANPSADPCLVGMDRYSRDEFQEAIKPLTSALQLQPGHYGAEYLLAVCRIRQGRYQEAKEGLTRCLEQRPDFLWPRLARGHAEMELCE